MNRGVLPKWHLELDRFRSFKTTFILEGNVFDLHGYRQQDGDTVSWIPQKLDQYLFKYLTASGYNTLVFYNHVDGFYNDFNENHLDNFLSLSKGAPPPSQTADT